MPYLLAALDALLQEHRGCGDLDGGIEGERVWLTCSCGALIVHPATEPPPTPAQAQPAHRERPRDDLLGVATPVTWRPVG